MQVSGLDWQEQSSPFLVLALVVLRTEGDMVCIGRIGVSRTMSECLLIYACGMSKSLTAD